MLIIATFVNATNVPLGCHYTGDTIGIYTSCTTHLRCGRAHNVVHVRRATLYDNDLASLMIYGSAEVVYVFACKQINLDLKLSVT